MNLETGEKNFKKEALKMYFPLVWSWYSSLAGNVFRVLLEHAARACLQGFSGWLVFSI